MIARKKSILFRLPAWVLSLFTMMLSFVLVFSVAALFEGLGIAGVRGELILNILLFLFVAIACYLISFIYPRSFWYVPILCNLITLISAIVEPIQLTPDWYYVMAGWGLSLTGALLGRWMARRKEGK